MVFSQMLEAEQLCLLVVHSSMSVPRQQEIIFKMVFHSFHKNNFFIIFTHIKNTLNYHNKFIVFYNFQFSVTFNQY